MDNPLFVKNKGLFAFNLHLLLIKTLAIKANTDIQDAV